MNHDTRQVMTSGSGQCPDCERTQEAKNLHRATSDVAVGEFGGQRHPRGRMVHGGGRGLLEQRFHGIVEVGYRHGYEQKSRQDRRSGQERCAFPQSDDSQEHGDGED